ncbi:MAG: hypothetical protein ACLP5H_34025 [Desulfomonilaceae bacterium]
MAKHQEKNLVWFLAFINLDLTTLSDASLFVIARELANRCNWLDEFSVNPPLSEPNLYECEITTKYDEEDRRQRINRVKDEIQTIQSDLRRFADKLLDEAWGSVADVGLLPSHARGSSYRLDLGVLRVPIAVNITITDPGQPEFTRNRGGKFSRSAKERVHRPFIEVKTAAPTNSAGAQFKFLEALNGLGLLNITKCERCGGFLFRKSEHVQFFCSKRCAQQAIKKRTRLNRKLFDPEAYERDLEAGKARARKSRDRKIEREGKKE